MVSDFLDTRLTQPSQLASRGTQEKVAELYPKLAETYEYPG